MKIFTRVSFLIVALCCWGIVGYGQTEIFNLAGGGAFPTGWSAINNNPSNLIDRGSYYLLDAGASGSNDIIESAVYDLSAYTNATFDIDIATFGSGGNNALKVEISFNGGVSYTQTEVTATPTSSSYISGGTINLASITNQVKFRFTNNGATGRGVRMQNLILEASGTANTDPEPTNHPTDFLAGTGTPPNSVIDLIWTDAVGTQLPAGYLIEANTTGTFSDPVDGTDPTEDPDLSDGEALVKVTQGTQFYSFSSLMSSTQYYFKIWPYTNAGANIDFKTDGTPLEDNATTEAECGITALGSATIACDSNTSGDDNDFVTISLPYTGVDAGATLTITVDALTESNAGDDPTAVTNGTISFEAYEGAAWSVTITGGNCDLSQSGAVPSSVCDPVPTVDDIRINEIDADTPGTDTQEFIELFSPATVNFPLDGLVLVLFNGSNDQSYEVFDLDGYQTDANGYFIIGTIAGAEIDIPIVGGGWLQNGADAVALYFADGSDFPSGTSPTTTNLIDALVYDTSDGDDTGLLTGLGQSEQINENENGNAETESIQRGSWFVSVPTPRALNVLPVNLLSFTAKALNNQTLLSFTTATEENNSHFLIQRSTDEGKTFQTIGQVDGKGDSASAVDYEFVDTKPAAGMNYYRLQQFDFDGTNEFFGPVAVRFNGEVADAPMIWPVPASDRLQIELPASDSDWLLEVFDLNGRRLLQQTTEEKGLNTFFDLNALPAGSYFLRWNNGSQSGQERFLKVQ